METKITLNKDLREFMKRVNSFAESKVELRGEYYKDYIHDVAEMAINEAKFLNIPEDILGWLPYILDDSKSFVDLYDLSNEIRGQINVRDYQLQ